MFPLLHDPRRQGAQVRPIDRRRDEHAHYRRQNRGSVLGGQHAEDAALRLGGGGAQTGICQRHDDGEGGLDGEVDGGELRLQGGELGAREGPVGDDSVDEGLVEGGAQEGAVAGEALCQHGDSWVVMRPGSDGIGRGRGKGFLGVRKRYLRMW